MAAQAVGFALCFALVFLFRGHFPEGEGDISDRVAKERPQGLRAQILGSLDGYRAVASDRLLRPFGVNIFFWYFLMQIANYLFAAGLDAATQSGTLQKSQDDYTLLYASVYTSSSIVALFIQSVITSAALRRLGIARVLFVLPLWYLATYAGAAISAPDALTIGFIAGVALQLGERIVIPAIHRPAAELVYSQVSADIRPRARAFLSGGVNAFGNMVAAVGLIVGLAASDVQTLLAVGTGLSVVYLYNTFHTRTVFGRRIAENITSIEPDVRRSAAEILATEHAAVPDELLRSLNGAIPADVEHGVRVALTRRGVLAVAADVTE